MKSDIDRLMTERNIDALVASGSVAGNPIVYYLTGGAHLTRCIVIKKRGEDAVLCYYSMERDEAAKTGMPGINLSDYDIPSLIKETGSELGGSIEMYRRLFADIGIKGKVAFYGLSDQGRSFALLNSLAEAIPEIEIEGEFNNTIFDEAQKTKSREEIERIREIGVKASNVMRQAIEFIQSHYEKDGFIVKQDQTPLTIGEVKRHVLKALFEVGLEDPEGMIFSIGRDAGVPHSKGESDSPIRIGESVVFDLFPRESGGGYFHDMTRTFSIGSARDDVQETFDQVKFCYDKIVDSLQVDELASRYQHMTCDIFEELGHETIRSNPKVENGYVHSLGHGLGIELHSHPRFSTLETNQDRLVPGSVFTIEPGLYYPDRGFGVRLEDVWTLNHDGEFECLTDFPKELVIKLTGSPDVGGIHRTN